MLKPPPLQFTNPHEGIELTQELAVCYTNNQDWEAEICLEKYFRKYLFVYSRLPVCRQFIRGLCNNMFLLHRRLYRG